MNSHHVLSELQRDTFKLLHLSQHTKIYSTYGESSYLRGWNLSYYFINVEKKETTSDGKMEREMDW